MIFYDIYIDSLHSFIFMTLGHWQVSDGKKNPGKGNYCLLLRFRWIFFVSSQSHQSSNDLLVVIYSVKCHSYVELSFIVNIHGTNGMHVLQPLEVQYSFSSHWVVSFVTIKTISPNSKNGLLSLFLCLKDLTEFCSVFYTKWHIQRSVTFSLYCCALFWSHFDLHRILHSERRTASWLL
jgi:hypothetical protein